MGNMLIISIGITWIRSLLINSNGEALNIINKKIPTYLKFNILEQNSKLLFDSIIEIIKEIINNSFELDSIGIICEPGMLTVIDIEGNPLMNTITTYDKRAKEIEHICKKNYKKYNHEYLVPWEYSILPKILWIKNNKPDIYKKIFKIVNVDGYIMYKLTGETAIDNYSALYFGYNFFQNSYNIKLLDSMDLDYKNFLDVKKVFSCTGVISGNIKEELNLKKDIEIITLSNNIYTLISMCFKDEKKTLYYDMNNSNICFKSQLKIKGNRGFIIFPYNNCNIYSIKLNYENDFIEWINDTLKENQYEINEYEYKNNDIITIPNMFGDSKYYNLDFLSGIIGINTNTSKTDIIFSSFESIGFALKQIIEFIGSYGIEIENINILSDIKNQVFYKTLSDITGKNIYYTNEQNDLLKNIYYLYKNKELNKKNEILSPQDENKMRYKYLYDLYRNTYHSMDNIYKYKLKVYNKLD